MILIPVLILALVLDLLSKTYYYLLPLNVAFCDFSNLTFNRAAAFSLPFGNLIMLFVSLAVIGYLFYYSLKNNIGTLQRIGLGLILGGALGNIYDRIAYGGVRDFIDCSYYPSFNIADAFIFIGVVIVFISSLRTKK